MCACGLIAFVAMSVALQQRPDPPVRHELSRFNHATRFQTIAPVGSLISRFRQVNPAPEFDILSTTSSNGLMSIDTSFPSDPHPVGRPPRFVPQAKVIRLAVLAPNDPEHQFSLFKILPAIHLAARTIERSSSGNSSGPLSGWRIQIVNRDSKCSSIYGPLEAIDLYNSKSIGLVVGARYYFVFPFLFFSSGIRRFFTAFFFVIESGSTYTCNILHINFSFVFGLKDERRSKSSCEEFHYFCVFYNTYSFCN